MEYAGCTIDELDAIVFYDKPLLKFERLLETYYAFAPKGIRSFITAMPIWLKEKLFLKKLLYDELKKIGKLDRKKTKLLFTEHHLSHAASAFYPSPFSKAAILTIDGVGEWATSSICLGEGEKISVLKELHFPHSLGLLYSAVTYYCGFKVNSGEYKLMGLAPYGDHGSSQVNSLVDKIRTKLVDIKTDGSIFLHQDYFDYATGLKMVNEKKWMELFEFPKRKAESELEQCYCDLALAIQLVTEEVVLNMATEAKRLTGADHLCMAGGVALNCVANGKLQEQGIFKEIFIQPAAGDAGGALGAALAGSHIYFGEKRSIDPSKLDGLNGSYLGPDTNENDILSVIQKYSATADRMKNEDELLDKVAGYLENGKVLGWHQGRMEFGPRALGARSILADARDPEMQKKLNLKIKYRESFRPFAPMVLAEDVNDFFEHHTSSPYMLLVKPVKKNRQIPYPDSFSSKDISAKLYFHRSDMPAITHIDHTARLQTVHKETNMRLWKLLQHYKQLTGYPVLVNTSFNVRGEPIVNTPEDSYRCFMRTEMDFLVIGDYIFDKEKQPSWLEKEDWKTTYNLD